MSVNEGCEKIIQILLSLGIPPDQMIESVQQYIIKKKWIVVKTPHDKPLDHQQKDSAKTQSLYCQFVYCYLMHCIHVHFEETKQYENLFANMFQISRRPSPVKSTA